MLFMFTLSSDILNYGNMLTCEEGDEGTASLPIISHCISLFLFK